VSYIRGVLIAGRFRTQRELMEMSPDDQRNTLIVELSHRTSQPVQYFQGLPDDVLAGAGAVLVFLHSGRIRTDEQLATITDGDQRNIAIVEIGASTGIPGSALQAMHSIDLVLTGLGMGGSPLRGVLLAGQFRKQSDLNVMSHEDHRNTVIVELARHSSQPVEYYQGMSDDALAGAGAIMVFLLLSASRTAEQLATITDGDQRNIAIVEVGASTGLDGPFLQSLSNLDVVLAGLGHRFAATFMGRRFCGVPDGHEPGGGLNPLTFGSPGGRWNTGFLTFSVDTTGCVLAAGTLPVGQSLSAFIEGVVANAFQQWQDASGFFVFSKVPSLGNIHVRFGGAELDNRFGMPGGRGRFRAIPDRRTYRH
jgi:hypothetical protein